MPPQRDVHPASSMPPVGETWFRAAFEHSVAAIGLVDRGGCILQANAALGRQLGCPEGDLAGRPFVDFAHPEDRDAVWQEAERVLRGEVPAVRFDKRAVRIDGRVIWADFSATGLVGADGTVDFLLCQSIDITERKRAEETARTHDARREALQRIAAEALGASALAEALPVVAATIAQVAGFPAVVIALPGEGRFDEVVVQAAAGFAPAAPGGDWRMPVARCLSGEGLRTDPALRDHRTFVGVPMRLAGLVRGCLVLARPEAWAPDEALQRWLAELADVLAVLVDRLSTAEELQRKESLLERICDLSPTLIFLADLERGRNVFFNRACLELTGLTADEMGAGGGEAAKVLHPDSLAALPAHFAEVAASGGEPCGWQFGVRGAAGDWRWLQSWDMAFERAPDGMLRKVLGVAIDITAQRDAAERTGALARERDAALGRLRLQFESLPLACIVSDAQDRVVDCNPATTRIFGFARDELRGRDCIETLVPQAERAAVRAFLSTARGQEATVPHLNLNLTRDGRQIWCEWHNTALHDATGAFVGFQFMARDVTEERRARAHVQAASDLLRKLSAQVPGVLFVFHAQPDGRLSFPFVSEATREQFGLEPAALACDGRALFETIHPDDRAALRAAFDEAGRLPTRFEAVFRVLRPGRPERWHLATAQPERLPDGSVVAHGFSTDITNQRRIEQVRLAEALRYKTLLSTASDGIHLLDADGRLVEANEAFCRHLGYTVAELTGRHIADWDPSWPADVPADRLAGVANGSGVFERKHRRKDGTVCEVEVGIAGLELNGRQLYFCASRDLTERRKAENERRQFELQMQQVQRLESLGVLAGGIAHDFNNLLTAILGNADLATFDLPPGSPAQEPLREIMLASRRAADLCRQMLAYAGREKLVVAPLALPALVEEMMQILRVSLGKKIAFRFECAPGLPLVEADAAQLRQVVMNLVINAAEAIGDREGVIVVRMQTEAVERDPGGYDWFGAQLRPGPFVALEVADTGCGMEPATLQRIFEPFFTTKFTGRGLGLSAVLGIVRGHHGALRVRSTLGRGTTFRILLPAHPEATATEIRGAAPAEAWRGRGRVLLVDDEEPVRRLGRRMLERIGFEVTTADGGAEALRRVDEPGADYVCIVLDVSMPGLDGAEVLAGLEARGCAIPVLLSSGYAASEVSERFAGRRIAGVLPKPYEMATMTACLRAVAPGKRAGAG